MKKGIIKSHLPLILAIGVPVVFIITVALVAWLPSLLARPQYDFVYYTASDYAYLADAYTIKDGKLQRSCTQTGIYNGKPIPLDSDATSGATKSTISPYYPEKPYCDELYEKVHFYRYNVKVKKSDRITETQALALTLNDDLKSPDGYELTRGGTNGPWGSGDYNKYYLVGNGARLELGALSSTSARYSAEAPFIGWVK